MSEHTYNGMTLDQLEAFANNDVLQLPTVALLIARIRELEAEQAELARMEDRILGWHAMDAERTIMLRVDREQWRWCWTKMPATVHIDTAPTFAAALKALYASLVAAGEIAP